MLANLLFCAVATGSYGFTVVDCYDTIKECKKEFSALECTRCLEDDEKTECRAYGIATKD